LQQIGMQRVPTGQAQVGHPRLDDDPGGQRFTARTSFSVG
jgi:hypothetical protein